NGNQPTDDFELIAGTLTFTPGDTSEDITFTINNDSLFEDDETFRVDLDTPSANATLAGGAQQHVHTIIDDEAPPTVQFQLTDSNANEDVGTHNVVIVA